MKWIGVITLIMVYVTCTAQSETNAKRNGVLWYEINKAEGVNQRKTALADILEVDYRMAVGSTDSILYETFTTGSHVNIPVNHPSFVPVFKQLKKNDKLTLVVSVDSFYKYTMLTPIPPYLHSGDSIHFYFRIYDVMNEKEFAKKEYAKELEAVKHDSIDFHRYAQTFNRVQRTKKGVYYVVSNPGNGERIGIGDSVTVKYRAYLFDGKVFERNMEGFSFMVGANQVIEGWEDGIRQMSLGARYKLIIPQHLAYGASGSGVVPPFTSVVFDVEVIAVRKLE